MNRPARDASLLHHALEVAKGKRISNFLISRLVRLHWNPKYFEEVKYRYNRKHRIQLEEAIQELHGIEFTDDFGDFCLGLVRSSSLTGNDSKPKRPHRKERIVIVDAPPTPRTPPLTFQTPIVEPQSPPPQAPTQNRRIIVDEEDMRKERISRR